MAFKYTKEKLNSLDKETENQISFMEVDGKIVFFNETEAVSAASAWG